MKISSLSKTNYSNEDIADKKNNNNKNNNNNNYNNKNKDSLPYRLEYLDSKDCYNNIPTVLIKFQAPKEWF